MYSRIRLVLTSLVLFGVVLSVNAQNDSNERFIKLFESKEVTLTGVVYQDFFDNGEQKFFNGYLLTVKTKGSDPEVYALITNDDNDKFVQDHIGKKITVTGRIGYRGDKSKSPAYIYANSCKE